jgi:hypothetical protein
MSEEPRFEEDYEPRQVAAARRVIVDVMHKCSRPSRTVSCLWEAGCLSS